MPGFVQSSMQPKGARGGGGGRKGYGGGGRREHPLISRSVDNPQIEFRSSRQDGLPWWLPPKQFIPTTKDLAATSSTQVNRESLVQRSSQSQQRQQTEDNSSAPRAPKGNRNSSITFDPVSGVYLPSNASLKHHRKKYLAKHFSQETEKLLGHLSIDGGTKLDVAARLEELQESLTEAGGGTNRGGGSGAVGVAYATNKSYMAQPGGEDEQIWPFPQRQHEAASAHIKRVRQEESFGPRDQQVMRLTSSLSSTPYVAHGNTHKSLTSSTVAATGWHPPSQDRERHYHQHPHSGMPRSSGKMGAPFSDGEAQSLHANVPAEKTATTVSPVVAGDSSVDVSQLLPPDEMTNLGAVAVRGGGTNTGRGENIYENETDDWHVMEISFCYTLCLPAEGNAVSFSPDGTTLAAGHECGLTLWTDRRISASGLSGCSTISTIDSGSVFGLRWSHDGQCIASGMFGDTQVHLWEVGDMRNACERTQQYLRQDLGHSDWVRSVAWSPDDSCLVSGGNDAKVKLWDVQGGQGAPITSFKHQRAVWCVDWSNGSASGGESGGGLIAAGDYAGMVCLYDPRSPTCVKAVEQPGVVTQVQWSGDGNTLLVANDSEGRCLRFLDARMMVAGGTGGAGGMSGTGEYGYTREFGRHTRCWSAAQSANGKYAISGGMDRLVKVWDVQGSRCLAELSGHKDKIRSVDWSSNDVTMASVSDDCCVRIWRME